MDTLRGLCVSQWKQGNFKLNLNFDRVINLHLYLYALCFLKAKGRWLFNLDTLSVGSVIGLRMDTSGLLFVSLNGQDTATVATELRPSVYACYFIIDVYGQCEEVIEFVRLKVCCILSLY